MSSEKSGHCATITCKKQGSPQVPLRAADKLASWERQVAVAMPGCICFVYILETCKSEGYDQQEGPDSLD